MMSKVYMQSDVERQLHMADNSRKVSFKYYLLNRNDVRIGELDGMERATISYGEFRTIKRSATFRLSDYANKDINFLTDQIQPCFVLHMPNGGTVEYPLGIFLADSPSLTFNGKRSFLDIGTCDKTLILEQDRFDRRTFFEAGTLYTDAIERTLSTAGIVKTNIEKSLLQIPVDRDYPVGTKKHTAINELLREMNYNTLWFDVEGVARSERYIEPSRRTVTKSYHTGEGSIVKEPITVKFDIADRPNIFIRVAQNISGESELYSMFENNSIESSISTTNRGRRIVDSEEVQDVAGQQELDDYVRRIAINSTTAYEYVEFDTILMPTHQNDETLMLNFPNVFGQAYKFQETGWEMRLMYDGTMRHSARRVVRI